MEDERIEEEGSILLLPRKWIVGPLSPRHGASSGRG
jgi:hypothetical protein